MNLAHLTCKASDQLDLIPNDTDKNNDDDDDDDKPALLKRKEVNKEEAVSFNIIQGQVGQVDGMLQVVAVGVGADDVVSAVTAVVRKVFKYHV